jgi:hypothetical protein
MGAQEIQHLWLMIKATAIGDTVRPAHVVEQASAEFAAARDGIQLAEESTVRPAHHIDALAIHRNCLEKLLACR